MGATSARKQDSTWHTQCRSVSGRRRRRPPTKWCFLSQAEGVLFVGLLAWPSCALPAS